MRRFFAALPRRVFLMLMLAGWALIVQASLTYFHFDELPAFVLEKLPLRFEKLFMFSLRAHVASAIVSLPVCTVLMTRSVQRRPTVHRWLGRAAGIVVLFVLVPSGAVLAFDAKGGPFVSAGFLLSGAIIAWFMLKGVAAARGRDLVAHRRAMRHVFAQMSVAVSSRVLILVLDAAGVDPEPAYVIALWVPVLMSAVVAELLSRGALLTAAFAALEQRLSSLRFALSKGNSRAITPLALLVRTRPHVRPVGRLGR
jgi:uncharacterized membrane protein